MAWQDYQNAFNRRNDYAQRVGAGFDGVGRFTLGGKDSMYASPRETDNARNVLGEHNQNLAAEQNRLAQDNMLQAQQESQYQAAHERNLQAAEQSRRHQETMGQQAVEAQKHNVLAGLLSRMPGSSSSTIVRNW